MPYIRKSMTYNALEYTGDTDAVTLFGATWSSTGNDLIQILVDCRNDSRLLAIGSYLLKDMAGNFIVVTAQDFSDYYEEQV